jgi:membrane protein DedA with SNARE-associated domain
MTLAHGEWIVFGWVLVNQGGLPVPVVPVLIGAGALAAAGHVSLAEAFALAVAGTLCADLVWYLAGRWRGARVLGMLGRISPGAPTLVRRAQTGFLAHARTFTLIARFVPEINPVAAGLAGATGVRVGRFVAWGIVSAIAASSSTTNTTCSCAVFIGDPPHRGGTFAKRSPRPSAIVGCARMASRTFGYGRSARIAVCTAATTSPASAPSGRPPSR